MWKRRECLFNGMTIIVIGVFLAIYPGIIFAEESNMEKEMAFMENILPAIDSVEHKRTELATFALG